MQPDLGPDGAVPGALRGPGQRAAAVLDRPGGRLRRGGGGRPRRLRILPYRLRADARDPQRRSDADVG